MIGGFETDWNETTDVWELHGHFVAFVRYMDELEPLRPYFQKARGVSRPMQVKRVKRLHRALAYCWKFAPMRKVGYQRNEKIHTRKMRLSDKHLREALVWLDERDPVDFVFLQRFKLLGTKLVRL
jgi:hypothetical protein